MFWVCSSNGRVIPSQGIGSGIDARLIQLFFSPFVLIEVVYKDSLSLSLKYLSLCCQQFLAMTEKGSEEAIEGLRNRIMKIVSDYQGNFSEIEILKQIMCESELLLATYNVRYFLWFNIVTVQKSAYKQFGLL